MNKSVRRYIIHYEKVPGLGFKPALARRDASMRLFSHFMDLALDHHILKCQVWAGVQRLQLLDTASYNNQNIE